MDSLVWLLLIATALAVGAVVGFSASRRKTAAALREQALAQDTALAQERAAASAEKARLSQEQVAAISRLEAESAKSLAAARNSLEASMAQGRRELAEDEQRITRRESGLTEREKALIERDKALERALASAEARDNRLRIAEDQIKVRETSLAERDQALFLREQSIGQELSRIAGLTPEQAKAELLAKLDKDLAEESAKRIARSEKDTETRAKELSTEIVARAIQRYAAEHTAESTGSKVKLPDPETKGRIIGKEGRNIKAFELATGVDVVIDETPDTVVVSCFDPVRREIAKRTLELLIADGRIQPARIEEVLAQVQQDMDRETLKRGEDAAFRCEVSGMHPQLLKLLGKLHFRTSYGQNVLSHVQEAAFLCGAMASDLGLDPKMGRRCGLLHDIGKAIDHEQEGSHPELGYEALKRWGESEIVANAALAHHEGHDVLTAYTVIAAAADAISAARPGARHQSVENYLKRLTQLETIALSFPGVQKAYAVQAGRELRVLVHGLTLPESEMARLARDIARTIEDQVTYPGEVKVTCIREMRSLAVAR